MDSEVQLLADVLTVAEAPSPRGLEPRSTPAQTTRFAAGLATTRLFVVGAGRGVGGGCGTTRLACAGPRRLGSIPARGARRLVGGNGSRTPHPRPPHAHHLV